jgi:STE24 endopeptidase
MEENPDAGANASQVDPAMTDPQRQRLARQYARLNRRLLVVDMALAGFYTLTWLFMGWSVMLRDALMRITQNEWLIVAGYSIVFFGLLGLISVPLSYYEGFVLPHRFGVSHQELKSWIIDRIKAGLVGGVFGLAILELIYFLLRVAPDTWWLWLAACLLLLNVVLANLAPVLLFPLFYKFEPLGEEHQSLVERLEQLAHQARTRVRGVYRFDMSRRTSTANAALTGLGNTRRILLSDTLLQGYSPDEIETILAHELGHHVHKDLPIGILVESVVTLVGLWLAAQAINWGVAAFGFSGLADIAALPLLIIVMALYGLVTMPLSNAYSRSREYRADEYAVLVTGKSSAFASALTRLADQNLLDAEPERWVEILFHSHPPVKARVAHALSIMPD